MPRYAFSPSKQNPVSAQPLLPELENRVKMAKTVSISGDALSTQRFIEPKQTSPDDFIPKNEMTVRTFFKMLDRILSGFYLFYFLPALVWIIFRIRCKKWTSEETILLAIPVLHALLIAAQIAFSEHRFYFTPRYALPLSPLFCGWTACAVLWIYEYSKRFPLPETLHEKLTILACVLFCIGLYADGLSPEIRE